MSPYMILFIICALLIIAIILVIRNNKNEYKNAQEKFRSTYGLSSTKILTSERMKLIGSYHDSVTKGFEVDPITWNDLDLDTLYQKLSFTQTEPGEALLLHYLKTPLLSEKELLIRENRISNIDRFEDFRISLQMAFRLIGLNSKVSYFDCISRIEEAGVPSGPLIIIRDLLPFICLGGMFINLPIFLILFFVSIGFNIRSYFVEKNKILPYLNTIIGILRIIEGGSKIGSLHFPEDMSAEREELLKLLKQLNHYRRGSFLLVYGAGTPTSSNPLDVLLEYVRMLFSIDLLKFISMRKEAILHKEEIKEVYRRIGELEAALCIACYRKSLKNGFCIPDFTETVSFHSVDLYHPFLENPIPNSFETTGGILLTGSNASGKSTFLRSVGLSVLMAQTIHTVTAKNYISSFFRLYTSMSLKDDLVKGDSYYMAEIKSIRRILEGYDLSSCKNDLAKSEANGTGQMNSDIVIPVICIVDEVLRGTNTAERIAASTEILRMLSGSGIICFAATHDLELTELLNGHYSNYHFKEDISNDDISFSYHICEGPATTRNAIKLLQMCGFPKELVEAAAKQADYYQNGKK